MPNWKLNTCISLLCVCLISLNTISKAGGLASGGVVKVEEELQPLKTTDCIKKSSSGNCKASEVTYSFSGAHCTEDCLNFNSFYQCVLTNKCSFDKKSRCFKKSTCIKFEGSSCKEWEDSPEC